jgi:cold shock protein
VAMGTVKWFNPVKGYGFIKPDGGGQDVFVHISTVEKAGYTNLSEGSRSATNCSPRAGARQWRLQLLHPRFRLSRGQCLSAAEE